MFSEKWDTLKWNWRFTNAMVSCFHKKWNRRYTTNGVISPGVVLPCWCKLLCATLRGRRQPEEKQNWLCLFAILYQYFKSNNTNAKCIRNYRFGIKPVWVRCSGNCFPVQAWKKLFLCIFLFGIAIFVNSPDMCIHIWFAGESVITKRTFKGL